MTELKDLRIKQEGDGWIVEYERLEDGAPHYTKFGPFTAKAEAERHWVECFGRCVRKCVPKAKTGIFRCP